MEEQLQDEIVWNHWVDQHLHNKDRYVSETRYQADEELPYGFQVTYRDGGPSYEAVDIPLATWQKEKAVELLDESYEALLRYFE
ncbi:hypothetical protein Harman_41770 [Haloarcula mannanilytica]|uniref:Uncharacterized protein n=1 Tax=Haloarcula mannanilytica TaxID=2509225 RepID=A0A4C2EPP9_9EURY|nr:hypothetical protein Harman_41770 [Haloarcula mannanilytica]